MTENQESNNINEKELKKLVNNLLSGISCLITTSIFILISIWFSIFL